MLKDMAFEEALYYIKQGRAAARAVWDGAKAIYKPAIPTILERTYGGEPRRVSLIDWKPSVADLLAKDWYLV